MEKADIDKVDITKHAKCLEAINGLGEVIVILERLARKVDGTKEDGTKKDSPIAPDSEVKIGCLRDFLIDTPEALNVLSDRMRKVIEELNEALF